jgi:uncharacterized membrane protein
MNLNDVMQGQYVFAVCFSLVAFALGAWVVYLFYARLRDIADELRKLRITYQFANEREAQRHSSSLETQTNPPGQPMASASDAGK